jgi:hypothetical protein
MCLCCVIREGTIEDIWCGFDRASSIICGNKMATRCNRWIFIADLIDCLLNMFRAPLCPSSGALEYYTSGCCLSYLVLGFQVVGTVGSWGLGVRFAGCCSSPQTGIKVPETCWASNKICNTNSSVASSWRFISTYNRREIYFSILQDSKATRKVGEYRNTQTL